MTTRNRKSVKGESKKEVVKCYIQKPRNFEVYFGRSENPEKDWLDFQKYVMRRNPIKKSVRFFIKALADDFQLRPYCSQHGRTDIREYDSALGTLWSHPEQGNGGAVQHLRD